MVGGGGLGTRASEISREGRFQWGACDTRWGVLLWVDYKTRRAENGMPYIAFIGLLVLLAAEMSSLQ